MAPMTRGRSSAVGIPDVDLMTKYYLLRAGVGLVITEGTEISPQAYGWPCTPGIWSDEQVERWREIVTGVHEHDGVIFNQLWHCGRVGLNEYFGLQPVAPSAIKIEGNVRSGIPAEMPRALETDEISIVVEEFRKAAENAKKAGFDGIELHGANGYLLDSFVQSVTNQRTDRYGGSIENRIRFPLEIIEAVSSVFPANRIGYRISPNGNTKGMGTSDYRETFLQLAKQLGEYKIGYIHVMDGMSPRFGFHEFGAPFKSEELRSVFPGTIIANVEYTKESAENAISEGKTDLVAFGRPLISNPDLVHKFKNNIPLVESNPKTYYTPGIEGYLIFPLEIS